MVYHLPCLGQVTVFGGFGVVVVVIACFFVPSSSSAAVHTEKHKNYY